MVNFLRWLIEMVVGAGVIAATLYTVYSLDLAGHSDLAAGLALLGLSILVLFGFYNVVRRWLGKD